MPLPPGNDNLFDDFTAGNTGSRVSADAQAADGADRSLAPATILGAATGYVGTSVVPAWGEIALFLNQISGFESLQLPFRGVLRISANSTAMEVTVTGLRARYNERQDFLVTTTPPGNEASPTSSTELLFPHFVTGGGYTTQFVLFSGSAG
jgi:hypothetical protein